MKIVSATRARDALYTLIDEVSETSEPVRIVGPRSAAVLISAEDWVAIEETLHRMAPRVAAARDW